MAWEAFELDQYKKVLFSFVGASGLFDLSSIEPLLISAVLMIVPLTSNFTVTEGTLLAGVLAGTEDEGWVQAKKENKASSDNILRINPVFFIMISLQA